MSAVRNFIITLILSLLIFGLIAYGIVQFALGAFGLDGKGDESQGTDSITVEPDGSVTDSPDDPGRCKGRQLHRPAHRNRPSAVGV